jgi:hypothetical protein
LRLAHVAVHDARACARDACVLSIDPRPALSRDGGYGYGGYGGFGGGGGGGGGGKGSGGGGKGDGGE